MTREILGRALRRIKTPIKRMQRVECNKIEFLNASMPPYARRHEIGDSLPKKISDAMDTPDPKWTVYAVRVCMSEQLKCNKSKASINTDWETIIIIWCAACTAYQIYRMSRSMCSWSSSSSSSSSSSWALFHHRKSTLYEDRLSRNIHKKFERTKRNETLQMMKWKWMSIIKLNVNHIEEQP